MQVIRIAVWFLLSSVPIIRLTNDTCLQQLYEATDLVNLHRQTNWGIFPSVSAAWRISEEAFWKGHQIEKYHKQHEITYWLRYNR